MPFNASDYIKPVDSTFATDRELQGDQTDLKINDLRRDTITCINALAGTPPSGSITVNSIDPAPTTVSAVKDLTPPVVYGTSGQRVVSTALGTMVLYNCSFDGAQFTADDTAAPATSVLVSAAGVTISTQVSTATPWVAWEKVETSAPGSITLSAMPTGSVFTVYGCISVGSTVNLPVAPFYTVINYGRHLTYAPTFTFAAISNTNFDTMTVTMTNLSGDAVKVGITPTGAVLDAMIVFSIDVTAP